MRKTIRVGIILLVVGLLLIMFGIANNGIQSVYWDQGFHIVRHKTRRYHVSQLKDITIATANNITINHGYRHARLTNCYDQQWSRHCYFNDTQRQNRWLHVR